MHSSLTAVTPKSNVQLFNAVGSKANQNFNSSTGNLALKWSHSDRINGVICLVYVHIYTQNIFHFIIPENVVTKIFASNLQILETQN